MMTFYLAKVEWYSDYDDKENTAYTVIAAENYSDAASVASEDWGEDNIISMEIHAIGDDDSRSFLISESMADALLHDIPEDVYCVPSEWRREQMNKEKN